MDSFARGKIIDLLSRIEFLEKRVKALESRRVEYIAIPEGKPHISKPSPNDCSIKRI
ncbi:MAG: hypothetical protein ACHQ1D_00455 [Nitrososphaerales archaeon]